MNIDKTSFTSPNYKDRSDKIDTIVIHSTHISKYDSLERLCSKESGVSCHYLLDLEGKIYQLVPEEKIAWHAGTSSWMGREALNQYSIGIEIVDTDNSGNRLKYFTQHQMDSVINLIKNIINRYSIDPHNIVAHSDIATDRKDDPGENFSWTQLSEHGIGIYPDLSLVSHEGFFVQFGDEGEAVILVQELLSKYGYKISVDGVFGQQTKDVVIAFKRHFDQRKINDAFDEKSLAILKDIISQAGL